MLLALCAVGVYGATPTAAPTLLEDNYRYYDFDKARSDEFIGIGAVVIIFYVGFMMYNKWVDAQEAKDAKIRRERELSAALPATRGANSPMHRSRSKDSQRSSASYTQR